MLEFLTCFEVDALAACGFLVRVSCTCSFLTDWDLEIFGVFGFVAAFEVLGIVGALEGFVAAVETLEAFGTIGVRLGTFGKVVLFHWPPDCLGE